MTKIVVDAAFRAQLAVPVEMTDESGRTVGYVISPEQFARIAQLEEDRKALYDWANSLVTDEELEAAEAEGGEFTHEQVMERLRQIEALEQTALARAR
ncbi:MAG TPA: hypothetical protein VGF55_12820 [Gemmataceae bacterium]|jgi:hypothetical protein